MDNDKQNKGTGTSIPGTGTSIPGTGTSIPGQGTSIPGAGTAIPGKGTAIPGAAGTAIPRGSGTALPGQENKSRSGRIGSVSDIPVLNEYVINGIRFTVDNQESAKTLANKSGEARIFVVTNGGRQFALKLYIPNHGPDHEILDKIKSAKGGFLVTLHDHGKWTDPSSGLTFDYEVMDYMSHGSLSSTTLRNDEKLFKDVAMRMAFAIRQSHDLGLIHRDVKPENFMFRDALKKDFVLIDFGIARKIVGDNPVKVDAAKSSYFVSPEGATSSTDRTTYVGRPTDYYSMGMTLLALLMGVDTFYKMYPSADLSRLDLQKRNNQVVAEARRKGLKISDHTADLLEALLEVSDAKRAGFVEVEKWYRGESLRKTVDDSSFRVVFNDVKNQVAHSLTELAKMMLTDVEYSKQFLYRDIAKRALGIKYPSLAISIDDITQKLYPRTDEQTAGVMAAVLLLDPEIPYEGIKNKNITTAEGLADEIWTNRSEYAKRLGKRTDSFWVYLAMRGDEKLKGLEKKYSKRVADTGANGIYFIVKELKPSHKDINLYGSHSITSRTDVAKMLWDKNESFAKEMKDRGHAVWEWIFTNLGNQPEFSSENITRLHSGIEKHGKNGIYALCLALDPDFPLFDIKGKPLKTQAEIAEAVLDYADNAEVVYDPSHILWTWLRALGGEWVKIADTYPGYTKEYGNTFLWDIHYRIAGVPRPYSVQLEDDNKWHAYHTLDELVKAAAEHGFTDRTFRLFTGKHFATWLLTNRSDEDTKLAPLAEKYFDFNGSTSKGWELFYRLRPDIGLNYIADRKSKNYLNSTVALGEALNAEIDARQEVTLPHLTTETLEMMMTGEDAFKKSQLHAFMKARNMDKHISEICKALNLKVNISAHPSAPYTIETALWRIVVILGAKPQYHFKDGKVAKSATDAQSISRTALDSANQASLMGFIALSYHENPSSAFSFDKLYSYYQFIKRLFPKSSVATRGEDAENRTYTSIRKRDSAWRSLSAARKICLWVCLPIMVLVITGISFLIATDGASTVVEAFENIGGVLSVIIGIIGAICGLSAGLIGAAAGGLAGWGLTKLIFWLLGFVAPYIVIAIMVAGAIWAFLKVKSATKDTSIPDKAKYNDLVNVADTYVVCYAFDTLQRTFGSTNINPAETFDASATEARNNRKQSTKALVAMIFVTLLSIGIGVLVTNSTRQVVEERAFDYAVSPESLAGDYTGTFHERPATMVIETSANNDNTITGTVVIQYSTPMVQQIVGEYDGGMLMFNTYENSTVNRSITYNGTVRVENGMMIYSGNYLNTAKGTSHSFRFEKPVD